MIAAAHGPRPWRAEASRNLTVAGNVLCIVDSAGYPAAFVPAWDGSAPNAKNAAEEAKANARLIAAAPDLFAVLDQLHTLLTTVREDQVSIKLGVGDTQAAKRSHAAAMAVFVQKNAEQVDEMLENAAQVLAKATRPAVEQAT